MKKTIATFPRSSGGALVGALVTITDHYSGAVATLYEDDEVTTKANPVTTDENGTVSFKVRNGVYDFDSIEPTAVAQAVRICGGGELYLLTNNSGGSIAYGKVCRFSTVAGEVLTAVKNSTQAAARASLVCITDGGVANAAIGVFISGPSEVTGLSGGTAGSLAYLSTTGDITTTATVTAGEYLCALGQWVTTTKLHFVPRDPTVV